MPPLTVRVQAPFQTPPPTPEHEFVAVFNEAAAQPSAERQARNRYNRARQRIRHLEGKLRKEEKNHQCYKKRYQREKRKNLPVKDSPRSKTNRMLGLLNNTCSQKVRRTLVFHNALISQLKQKYLSCADRRTKYTIAMLTRGSILRKYKVLDRTRRALSCQTKQRHGQQNLIYKRKTRSDATTEADKQTVKEFFERDDSSRMMPGKKDTVTKNKTKKQRRILSDSIKTLYAKFCFENPLIKLSYALFCSLRPFWVTFPKLADRNTCLCKRHDNIQLMANKLHLEGAFQTNSLCDQYRQLVCSETSQKCMYGTCHLCKETQLPRLDTSIVNKEVSFSQWVTQQEERVKYVANEPEKKFQIKITSKQNQDCRMSDLHDKFENELKPRFTTHEYNIRHQYSSIRQLRESLQDDEIVVHVDFSENYSCKSSEEIQSVHFGASHRQVTLHTGVAYTQSKKMPFCSISNSTRHDPSAIWAHLKPVLLEMSQEKRYTSIHFITDVPTTQYRNKNNFFLATTIPQEYGFQYVTWNFLEAGHGKGAADGIGGAVKRQADRFVSQGQNVTDAETLFRALEPSTSIKLYLINEEDVQQIDPRLLIELRPVPQTMKIHQLVFSSNEPGVLYNRILSCFCKGTKTTCQCFDLEKWHLQKESPELQSNEGSTKTLPHLYPVAPSDSLLDKWCIILYDDHPYPGIVVDYDEDAVEVKSMSRIGENRFYWPMREDRIWYEYHKVLTIIPQPTPVGSRHVEVKKELWEAVCQKLDSR